MHRNRRKPLIIVVTLVLLFAIPLTVWLILNSSFFLERRAVEDEVTVNLIPTTVTSGLAETFTLDVFINSDDLKISGATISLSPSDANLFQVNNISFETGEGKPFTDELYNSDSDPYTFTVLAKRPDAELPSGSIKVATVTLQSVAPGDGTIGVNTQNSEIVGVKPDSDTVNFTVVGTQASISNVGELCQVNMCTEAETISLIEQPRDDRKFDIQVLWDEPDSESSPTSTTPLYYKLYRGIGSPADPSHSQNSLVATTLDTTFTDTNQSAGFEGEQTVYYDIDTYIVCPGSIDNEQNNETISDPTPTSETESDTSENTNEEEV